MEHSRPVFWNCVASPIMRSFELVLVVIFSAYGATEAHAASVEKTPAPMSNHLEQSTCATCHLSGAKAIPENAHLLVNTQKKLCSECHEKSVRLSHRSEFTTKAVAPLVYPLNWKSELVCSTCHQIHAPIGKSLRGTRRGKEFCLICHQPKFFADLATGGIKVSLSVHESGSSDLLQHELDPASMECLRCHSVLTGKYEVIVDPSLIARHAYDSPYDHPIGRPYRNNSSLGLRSSGRSSSGVQLIQGGLSCLSCHKKDGTPHAKLLLPLKKEKLCKECHEFKN